jgi:tRNA (guanine37-N1)-methyltransferase
MRFDIITIFPEMFTGVFSGGVVGRALDKEVLRIVVHDLRDFTTDKHRQVDDRPYGGLEGMVLKPEPVFRAVEAVRQDGGGKVYLLSPQGRTLDAGLARELAAERQVVLICGRYEGVDERVAEHLADGEISIGDYVLSGGELAAAVVVDAVARFVPGVVGKAGSVRNDSFSGGILDYPQYTRPEGPLRALLGRPQADRALEAEESPGKDGPAQAGPCRGRRPVPGRPRSSGGKPERKEQRMNVISAVEDKQLKKDLPPFNVGDTVKVHVIIREGDKERVQIFRGDVIGKRGGGLKATFTVRKVSFGIGVERVFPLHSKMIKTIEVVRKARVRRAKLYYLRDLKGKAARLKEDQG